MKKWLKRLWKKILEWFEDPESSFDYSKLDWCYGGERARNAVEDVSQNGFKLNSVSANEKGVKFSGKGKMWGYTHDHADARNCIFFLGDDGAWHGGFWEWGSVDRTYRDFNNIYSGYKGWKVQPFLKSKRWLFFVMTRSGDKRSNGLFIDR